MPSTNQQLKSDVLGRFDFSSTNEDRLELYRLEQQDLLDTFAEDVLSGLSAPNKYLLPKYFYDDAGSQLFDRITETPEYYPKRVEKQLLADIMPDLVKATGGGLEALIELGSGTSEKTHILLKSLISAGNHFRYVPIDVSEIIIDSSERLLETYPNLCVTGIIASYEAGLGVISYLDEKRKLLVFLGSSIGNLNRSERQALLEQINDALDPGDYVLIGFDLLKDRNILHKAYNDKAGVTRQFNLNLLRRINRELGGGFDLKKFEHHAFFNSEASRIEMHLIARVAQEVRITDLEQTFSFHAGESIHTENSYKFSDAMIGNLVRAAGFSHVKTWKDPKAYFALSLIRSV